jgi:ribosomal protein S16
MSDDTPRPLWRIAQEVEDSRRRGDPWPIADLFDPIPVEEWRQIAEDGAAERAESGAASVDPLSRLLTAEANAAYDEDPESENEAAEAEAAVRASLARIRAVVEAAINPPLLERDHQPKIQRAFSTLTPDDRRLLGMEPDR